MLSHEQFLGLSQEEKSIFISKLAHAISNDYYFFHKAAQIVHCAEIAGIFDNVKFGAEAVFNTDAYGFDIQD